MGEKQLLSVVVVICNRAPYIRACLDSIRAQRCVREIICVDDASTDGTQEILREYQGMDERIRLVLHEKNEGGHITLYDGMAQCTGSYLTVVDGDDMLIPGALDEICRQAVLRDADVVEFGFRITPEGDCPPQRAERERQSFNKPERLLEQQNFCRLCLIENQLLDSYVGKLYTRVLYRQVFDAMERIPMGNMYPRAWYAVWLFCFFARRWYTTEIIGYHYFPGRGMTHHLQEQLSHLQGNFGAVEACASLRRTAWAHGVLPEHEDELEYFLAMCRAQSVITWAARLPMEDVPRGWQLLVEAWGMEDVLHVLMQKYDGTDEALRQRLEIIHWPENGGQGAACLLYADGTPECHAQLILQARALSPQPLILAEEMVTPFPAEAIPLPQDKEKRTYRNWLLRQMLRSGGVGTVVMADSPAGFGDELVARSLGCMVHKEAESLFE